MSKRNLLIAGVVTGIMAITGCSQEAENDRATQSTGTDVSTMTDNAVDDAVVKSDENLKQSVMPADGVEVKPDLSLSEVIDEDQQY